MPSARGASVLRAELTYNELVLVATYCQTLNLSINPKPSNEQKTVAVVMFVKNKNKTWLNTSTATRNRFRRLNFYDRLKSLTASLRSFCRPQKSLPKKKATQAVFSTFWNVRRAELCVSSFWEEENRNVNFI